MSNQPPNFPPHANIPPSHSPQVPMYGQHQPPQSQNGLGIAGFVTSLVGWVSCGMLSPIGLILSLIALTKQPRGFAIAGTIIGTLGSLFLVFIGIGFIIAAIALVTGGRILKDYAEAHGTARQAYVEIDALRKQGGTMPDTATADRIAQKHIDPWGAPLKAEEEGGSITIVSSGRDKQFGTKDDLHFSETELQSVTPTTMHDLGEDSK